MRDLLRHNNQDLLRDLERMREPVQQAASALPQEMQSFYDWLIVRLDTFQQLIEENLRDLDRQQDSILPDILSNTQVVTRYLQLFNRFLISPVIRVQPSDRLCLKLLSWLHAVHPKTSSIPVAMSDGDFASWPDPRFPTIYFMPPSAQRRLLYLPLFFHEFGHLLFACHKQEMEDLITDLQKQIADFLEPRKQQGGSASPLELEQRNAIVETWFEWTQEIFCDAVGFVIGGPVYAYSFSMYFRMRSREEYHVRLDDLIGRTHPVTWLRIRLITDRARRMGLVEVAQALEDSWQTIAAGMGVNEDYSGFFEPKFLPAIQQTIDDMLTEAAPYQFTDVTVNASAPASRAKSPAHLVNQAWDRFFNNADDYADWEAAAIKDWLASA